MDRHAHAGNNLNAFPDDGAETGQSERDLVVLVEPAETLLEVGVGAGDELDVD